jgi:hypothetical protein
MAPVSILAAPGRRIKPSALPGAVLENAMMKKFFAAARPCFAGRDESLLAVEIVGVDAKIRSDVSW